jgi:hypothetical protein
MKSNEVGTTLKHPETINGNVKNLSKRMKMKDKYYHNPSVPKPTPSLHTGIQATP